jgi:hypothetical protein
MCGDVQFVSREKWEAKKPKNTEHMATPVSIVFVHHTVTSVPITTKVVSSNPAHGEVYPIQHYVITLIL